MMRAFDSKLEAEFDAFLVGYGYPVHSILHKQAIHGSNNQIFQPDFLIIDPINFERLAVIEVKGKAALNLENVGVQLQSYRKVLGDMVLPAFLVTTTEEKNTANSFEVFSMNDNGKLEKIDSQLFPKFQALVANKVADQKNEISGEKKGVTASFEKVSWITAGILSALVVADFVCSLFGIEVLTIARLSLIGGVVALVVIPYTHKIKGLGIEWERAASRKNENS